jgi:hypothetical protein
MRRISVLLMAMVLLAAGLAVACYSMEEHGARTRVEMMMNGWSKGGRTSSGDIQTAVCMWYEGSLLITDRDTLGQASVDFDIWRREKDLYRELERWEIPSIAKESDAEPRVWIVSVDIEGDPYRMRVQEYVPIEWLD